MKSYVLVPWIVLFCVACGSGNSEVPDAQPGRVADAESNQFRGCPKIPADAHAWSATHSDSLKPWLSRYQVTEATPPIDPDYLARFAGEFEKVPEPIRRFVASKNGYFDLVYGQSVTESPNWKSEDEDGQAWSNATGAGGASTPMHRGLLGRVLKSKRVFATVVVNRLYDEEGSESANLVLHAQAHNLDAVYSKTGLSTSDAWLKLYQQPDSAAYFRENCGAFCSRQPEEAFAEGFARYYACDSTRTVMEASAPQLAEFFHKLPTGL